MKTGRLVLRAAVGGFYLRARARRSCSGGSAARDSTRPRRGFHQIGMRPGRRNAIAAGVSEAAGGTAIVLGFRDPPLAASTLIATMLTAIHRVHLKNGPWNTAGGYEYNVVLIAALLSPGRGRPGRAFARSTRSGWSGADRIGRPSRSCWARLARPERICSRASSRRTSPASRHRARTDRPGPARTLRSHVLRRSAALTKSSSWSVRQHFERDAVPRV